MKSLENIQERMKNLARSQTDVICLVTANNAYLLLLLLRKNTLVKFFL